MPSVPSRAEPKATSATTSPMAAETHVLLHRASPLLGHGLALVAITALPARTPTASIVSLLLGHGQVVALAYRTAHTVPEVAMVPPTASPTATAAGLRGGMLCGQRLAIPEATAVLTTSSAAAARWLGSGRMVMVEAMVVLVVLVCEQVGPSQAGSRRSVTGRPHHLGGSMVGQTAPHRREAERSQQGQSFGARCRHSCRCLLRRSRPDRRALRTTRLPARARPTAASQI
mmetsp:Transcript_4804/g.15764  ORF Transcript_4804/g.15764 Transcript_4804/m.15764 type:complete len:230 (-) Transcript_4804:763-1452(-)